MSVIGRGARNAACIPYGLTPLVKPPFAALDLRLSSLPYPFFKLGGLHTNTHAEVLTPDGDTVVGLYAAGRTSSGLPARGYSGGLSLADTTFFGRRAGQRAAVAPRYPDFA